MNWIQKCSKKGTTSWIVFDQFLLKYWAKNQFLGGGFKKIYVHPYLGKISNLTNIVQMGWNHQLDFLTNCIQEMDLERRETLLP